MVTGTNSASPPRAKLVLTSTLKDPSRVSGQVWFKPWTPDSLGELKELAARDSRKINVSTLSWFPVLSQISVCNNY